MPSYAITQAPLDRASYPDLREVLAPEYAEMPSEALEALVEQTFGPIATAADYDEFLGGFGRALSSAGRSVGNFVQQAAPVVKNIAPAAAQGAMSGAALGPWGMLGGAVLGGAGAALQRYGGAPALRTVGGALSTGVNIAGALRGGGGVGAGLQALGATGSPAGGSAAPGRGGPLGAVGGVLQALGRPGSPVTGLLGAPGVGQWARLITRPEVQQALGAALMSPVGRRDVNIANTPIPVGAILNLLGRLGEQAAAEYSATIGSAGEGTPAYLLDEAGEFRCDPANADERAGLLIELFDRAEAAELLEAAESDESDEAFDESDEAYDETDEAYDESDEAYDETDEAYDESDENWPEAGENLGSIEWGELDELGELEEVD